MLDKLIAIEAKYSQIEARLAAPETYDDPAQVARLNKEQAELAPLVETFRTYQQALEARDQAHALLGDPEMRELAQEEYDQALKDIPRLEREIQILLLPKDPNDHKNVIVEIRAGVGGEEAALFAHSLYRMYAMYAERRGWRAEVNSVSETELGGVKEISFTIEGEGAFSRLKYESGVHRVQRVPETESGGRVHTSTVTVAVLPEMETADVRLDMPDSVSGTRCTRWTPLAYFSREKAPSPSMVNDISFTPPSSVSLTESTSARQPRRSAYILYMR